MKKRLQSVALILLSVLGFSTSASALNAYAYGLKSNLSDDKASLNVTYSLNTSALSGQVIFYDGNTIVKSIDLTADQVKAGVNSVAVPTADLTKGKALKWSISVTGNTVATPTEATTAYRFYHPASVAVDNNVESANFGRILVTESMAKAGSPYHSGGDGDGQGLYAFDPQLNPIANSTGKYAFKGGATFSATFSGLTTTSYDPRKVRISKDGRIFLSGQNSTGTSLWEVNPNDLNSAFTPIFHGTVNADTYEVYTSGETPEFITAPNVSLDTKGSGADLKILMLSTNKSGIGFSYAGYRTDEYNLGTATSWNTAPSKNIPALSHAWTISHSSTTVVYDNEGGIWYINYRATPSNEQPAILHINAAGEEDYRDIKTVVRSGGICFNHDFTRMALTNAAQKIGIYKVGKDAENKPTLTLEYQFATNIGNNCNDIAWDAADNLYIVGNSSEWFKAFALPKTDGITVTPAASKYEFTLVEEKTKVYVIGETEGNSFTWDPNVGTEMTETATAGVYELTTKIGNATPNGYFAFTTKLSTDWAITNQHRYAGSATGNSAIAIGKSQALVKGEGTFEIPKGEYKFTVNMNDMTVTTESLNPVAHEYSLVQLRKFTTNLPAVNETRDCAYHNGKLYIQDKTNKNIQIWTKDGKLDTTIANSGTGTNITSDEAGNIIVWNGGFSGSFAPEGSGTTSLTVFPADGSDAKKITLTSLPTMGRIDFFAKVRGNILDTETGGEIYIPIAAAAKFIIIPIIGGVQDIDNTATITLTKGLAADSGTQVYAMGDNSIIYNKRGANNTIVKATLEASATGGYSLINEELLITPKHNASNGSDVFNLDGVNYIVYPNGTNYLDGFSIAAVSANADNAELISHKEALTANPNAFQANWVFAQPVSKSRALIYQYVPGGYIAIYEFNTFANQYPGKLYVAGNVNAAGWDFCDPNTTLEPVEHETGIYKGTVTLLPAGADGYGYFGISSTLGVDKDDWAGFNAGRYGATTSDEELMFGIESSILNSNTNAFKTKAKKIGISVDLPFNKIVLTDLSGMTNVTEPATNVVVVGGVGEINVLGEYKTIEVFTLSGAIISQNKANITCPAGIYLVRVNNKTTKVIVK